MKFKKILKSIDQHKLLLLLLSLFLSILIVVGSTYSWITYSDERINVSKPNQKDISATIDETYTPNLQWLPGEKTEKILTVRNNGQIPAIVRVSLYEFFMQFELNMTDQDGNSGFSYASTPSKTEIIAMDTKTWGVGNTYKVAKDHYLIAKDTYKADTQDSTTAYKYNENRTFSGLNYLTIQFNQTALYDKTNQPANETKNYWYYSEGYFYYSEVLQPGEKTIELIQSVTLDNHLPNSYKGSMYQLVPVMEAHDITKALFNDWNLNSGSFEEKLYRQKIY